MSSCAPCGSHMAAVMSMMSMYATRGAMVTPARGSTNVSGKIVVVVALNVTTSPSHVIRIGAMAVHSLGTTNATGNLAVEVALNVTTAHHHVMRIGAMTAHSPGTTNANGKIVVEVALNVTMTIMTTPFISL